MGALALLAAFPVASTETETPAAGPSEGLRTIFVKVEPAAPVKEDEDLQKVRENLITAVMTKVRVRPSLREAPDLSSADLQVSTVISRLRYVSAATRVMTRGGRARLRADVTLLNQVTGTVLWTAAIDTVSAGAGIFGSSTTSQVEYLSTQIVTAIEGCVAGSCPPNLTVQMSGAEADPAVDAWRAAVVRAIRAAWDRPADSTTPVDCELQITVDSRGKLTNVGWLDETPERGLNKSIVKAFKAASPYPPPPPQVVKDDRFRTVITFTDADGPQDRGSTSNTEALTK